MKAFAKAFYESAAWRRTRAYILKRDAGAMRQVRRARLHRPSQDGINAAKHR